MEYVPMNKEILDVINAVIDYGKYIRSHQRVVNPNNYEFDHIAEMEKYYNSLPLPDGMSKNRNNFERILEIGLYSNTELKLLNNFEEKDLGSVNWCFADTAQEEEKTKDKNPWLIMSDSIIVRPSFSAEQIAAESWKSGYYDVLEFDDEIGCEEYPGKVYVALYHINVNDPALLEAKKDVLYACGMEDMIDNMDEISPELWAKELVVNNRSDFNPGGFDFKGDNELDEFMITYEHLNNILIKLGAPEELIERGSVSKIVDNATAKCEMLNKENNNKNNIEFEKE